MSKDGPSYAIGIKLKDVDSKGSLKVPGPGQYDLADV